MSDKIYDVPADWRKRAYVDDAKYKEMYARSVKDPNGFWGEQAKRIDWIKPFSKVKNTSYAPGNISIKWLRRLEVSDKPYYTREETSKYTDLITTTGKSRIFTFTMEAK